MQKNLRNREFKNYKIQRFKNFTSLHVADVAKGHKGVVDF